MGNATNKTLILISKWNISAIQYANNKLQGLYRDKELNVFLGESRSMY